MSKRKRKKNRKRKLPRVSSCGYKFLPRSRRLLGMNSTLSLRDGGPWLLRSILAASCPHGEGLLCFDTVTKSVARAVRTWIPGLSTSHWYLAATCSVLVLPDCCGGFFWELTSGFISVFSAIWFDNRYMCLSVYGGLGFAGCDAPRALFLSGSQALMRCIMASDSRLHPLPQLPTPTPPHHETFSTTPPPPHHHLDTTTSPPPSHSYLSLSSPLHPLVLESPSTIEVADVERPSDKTSDDFAHFLLKTIFSCHCLLENAGHKRTSRRSCRRRRTRAISCG